MLEPQSWKNSLGGASHGEIERFLSAAFVEAKGLTEEQILRTEGVLFWAFSGQVQPGSSLFGPDGHLRDEVISAVDACIQRREND